MFPSRPNAVHRRKAVSLATGDQFRTVINVIFIWRSLALIELSTKIAQSMHQMPLIRRN